LHFLTGEKEFLFSDTVIEIERNEDGHFGKGRTMNLMTAKKILQIKFLLFLDLVKDFLLQLQVFMFLTLEENLTKKQIYLMK